MKPDQEREFLIRLAPVWLACRWRAQADAEDADQITMEFDHEQA